MDTKSRSIKYSYALKIAAFLAAVTLVFASVWNGVSVVRMIYDYGWENLMVRDKPVYTNAARFQRTVGTALENLETVYVSNSWDDYRAANYASLEDVQADALESFRKFRTETETTAKHRYAQDVSDTVSADGEIYYETTASDGAAEATLTDEGREYIRNTARAYSVLYNTNNTANTVLFRYSMTEEEVATEVEKVYNNLLASAKRTFESEVIHAQEELSALVNFRFLLVDNNTGKTYSNMGVRDANSFFSAVTEEDWFFGYTTDKGLTENSDSAPRDKIYGYGSGSTFFFDSHIQLSAFLDKNFSNAGYDVYVCVPQYLQAGDVFSENESTFRDEMTQLRTQLLCTVLFLAGACVLSLYLVLVTGRVRDTDGVKLSALDKIPTDIYAVVCVGLAVFCVAGAFAFVDDLLYGGYQRYVLRNILLSQVGAAALCMLAYTFLMAWITEIAKYVKSKTPYFKSMFLYRICRWCGVKGGKLHARAKKTRTRLHASYVHTMRHISKKAGMFAFGYVAVNFLCAMFIALEASAAFFLLVLIAVNVITAAILWKHLVALDKIMDAAEQSKNGEMPQDIGASVMPEPLKTLAQNLSFTQEEMQKAVAEGIKGERMKTELITNVSHDLKTPLTSIISYVDLLKKCDILDTDAQKYITVLDEKSGRLKRLIEDLVEASKASSGAVTLNKMQVNLYELAVQAIGELEDGFQTNGLQVVLNTPETAPIVFVDSQKTWRIIDNLLNNARKYSLGGSRVYVDIAEQGGFGQFVIKNISGEALNIDPDELTQRFVRGDTSRTKEGSGLGLSIAKALCTLQGGTLKIEIDGDLFKATVSLPKAGGVQMQSPAP